MDRGVADISSGSGARYNRAAKGSDEGRNPGLDRIPRHTETRQPGETGCRFGSAEMRACIVVISILLTLIALPGCRKHSTSTESKPLDSAYGTEPDWNNPQHLIPLSYLQVQGQRIFYSNCV